jgi:hypothetical protein
MRVLFYRDCRTINRIQIAKVTVKQSIERFSFVDI